MDFEELQKLSDGELVRRFVRDGSMESYKALYERYKSPIFNFLFQLLRNREAAEDCAQEAFIELYRKAGSFRAESKFSTWLYQIARNRGLDEIRKRKLRGHLSLDAAPEEGGSVTEPAAPARDAPDAVASSRDLEERLRDGLGRLEPRDREIIALCDIQGLPHEEVGRILGEAAGTVTVRLYRARRRLAAILGMKEDFL
jgi:RNA polymerase sigma-70 factor (ECF subfamily)